MRKSPGVAQGKSFEFRFLLSGVCALHKGHTSSESCRCLRWAGGEMERDGPFGDGLR